MISVVLGRRGSGKTTWIRTRLRTLSRVLVFDTLAEYGSDTEASPDLPSFLDAVERSQGRYFRISFVPYREDPEAALDIFLRAAWIVGDLTVVIDEVDAVSSPVSVPWELQKLIRYGRHRRLSVIVASRRAAEVPRLITSQADEVVSFNQSEPTDLEYLRRYVSADFADTVSGLPRYEHRTYEPWGKGPDSAEKMPIDKPEAP